MTTGAPLLVGVDIGTTRVKAGVIGLDGTELADAAVRTLWQPTSTGAEARPDDFLTSVRNVLADVLAAAPPGPVLGLGVASMAETAVLLDAGRRPLGPAVAWYDQRAQAEFASLLADISPEEYGRRTGLAEVQVPTVATLRWLMAAYPGLRRAAHALSVSEWVVQGLGGRIAAEASLASRTGALDVGRARWWPEVLEWADLPPTLFPPVTTAGSSWGRAEGGPGPLVRLQGAQLTVAGHDHLVASIGCGVTDPRQAMDSCGTAEAIVRAVPLADAAPPEAGLPRGVASGLHVLPETRSLLVGLRLGIDLNHVLSELGVAARDGRTPLDREVGELLAGGREITSGTEPAQRWHATLAAATQRTAAALADVEQLGGPLDEVRISGGWAANPVLVALKATALTRPVYPVVHEAGVRGAALLAGRAAGVYAAADEFPAPDLADAPARESELPVPAPLDPGGRRMYSARATTLDVDQEMRP